jgi:conjugal transfer pilus assembly protein TrbC
MKKILFSALLVSAFACADQDISINESDLKSAESIMQNMLKDSQGESSLKVAELFREQGVNAVSRGVRQEFNTSTLNAFGINRDSLSEPENPNMIGEQFVMFVSASMPLSTLRAYARDLSKVRGVMAIKGAQGGLSDYLKTRQWIWSVIKKDRNCKKATCDTWQTEIVIDPVLFEMYEIKQVPALIFQPDMKIGSYCDDETKAVKASAVAYGDAYLGRLIDSLIRQSPNSKDTLERLKVAL